VPVPAPFLTGPQGAGKSTGGRMLVRIIEGMSGDLRIYPQSGYVVAVLSNLDPPAAPQVSAFINSRLP